MTARTGLVIENVNLIGRAHALADLGAKAATVAANALEHDDARRARIAAGAELLNLVVEAIRPALPSLVSKVNGTVLRGLVVGESPEKRASILYLSPAPRASLIDAPWWFELDADGDSYQWRFSTDVAADWPIDEVLDRIAEALDAQANGATAANAERTRERALHLGAIATLVRAVK